MKQKYKLSYTMKLPETPGYHYELFRTKAEAKEFIKENKSKIYWKQLSEINPKSKKPKTIFEAEPIGYMKKIGTLQTYLETGMECLGLVFYEDGVYGEPNPDFDPSKPESRENFSRYSSFAGVTFIDSGQILKLPSGELVGMIKDRDFAKRDAYNLSFYPQGFSKDEWLDLFGQENTKVTIWIKDEQ